MPPKNRDSLNPDKALWIIFGVDFSLEMLFAFRCLCDNQCLSFLGVLLGKALKTMFLENYPYPSSFHTETRRAMIIFHSFRFLPPGLE
ncbi:MAG: hypothetical protein EWV76_09675 [Microcystis novacekii Mn_MB_F_20050700_S1]|nr:MAG: hypothetical protein EWV76_09675 [Microcystis novacekii Mn_MB_F_20050700_S1]